MLSNYCNDDTWQSARNIMMTELLSLSSRNSVHWETLFSQIIVTSFVKKEMGSRYYGSMWVGTSFSWDCR